VGGKGIIFIHWNNCRGLRNKTSSKKKKRGGRGKGRGVTGNDFHTWGGNEGREAKKNKGKGKQIQRKAGETNIRSGGRPALGGNKKENEAGRQRKVGMKKTRVREYVGSNLPPSCRTPGREKEGNSER